MYKKNSFLKFEILCDWGNWEMRGRWLETVLVSDVCDGVGLAIISDE
jgi:hypothetical protein